ncbi:hypothetical protein [Bifidobacterium tissieri]|uniref:Uncharacterized protein n=1 Tax=Bifidobacterium tissieri TaxID=1630162 RepID=A0A5M9ZWG0_9BIFI|nr:hypothetical protein [Bifidobacterium tissieri]KAA8828650.1 hypothetical protein EM849_11475 [Bifidobacterium tissieri]KAA8831593.1 hypothetical protein EMO89_02390 [Bifidobacterium tissieri]
MTVLDEIEFVDEPPHKQLRPERAKWGRVAITLSKPGNRGRWGIVAVYKVLATASSVRKQIIDGTFVAFRPWQTEAVVRTRDDGQAALYVRILGPRDNTSLDE